MVEVFDIVIRRARTRFSPDKLLDIAIADGKIVEISEHIHGKGEHEIDAIDHIYSG